MVWTCVDVTEKLSARKIINPLYKGNNDEFTYALCDIWIVPRGTMIIIFHHRRYLCVDMFHVEHIGSN